MSMGVLSYQHTGSSRGQQTSSRNMSRRLGRLWTIHHIKFGYDLICCEGRFLPAMEHAPALPLGLGVRSEKYVSRDNPPTTALDCDLPGGYLVAKHHNMTVDSECTIPLCYGRCFVEIIICPVSRVVYELRTYFRGKVLKCRYQHW